MPKVTASTTASPDCLWAIISDLDRWAERLPTVTAVRALDGSASQIGSRYELRQPGLPKAVYRITDWTPGTTFTWVSRSPGITTTATHQIREADGRTWLDLGLVWTGPLSGLVDRLLGPKAEQMITVEAETFIGIAERA